MPNQWEEFAKGLIAGGTNFASGLIERSGKNQAEQQYQTGRKYIQDQYQSLLDSNKRLIDKANTNIGNDNEVLTQNKNVSLPPVDQQVQDSYEKIFAQTQTGLNDILMKLKNNKYGQEYAKGLEQLYGQLFSSPEYQIIQGKDNSITAINKKTLQTKELRKGTEKPDSWTYQDITTDNPDGSQTVTQYAIDKTNPNNKINMGSYTIPKDEPKLSGRTSRVGRTSRNNSEDGLSNKEVAFNNTMKAYEEAVKSGNEKKQEEIKQSFSDTWGRDIETSYQKWGYVPSNTKKSKDYLKKEVRDYDQFNEAYNQTYYRDKIGKGGQSMDSWFKTLYQAQNKETLDSWYDEMWNYLEGIGNQINDEVYNRIGKSLNSYYNDAVNKF